MLRTAFTQVFRPAKLSFDRQFQTACHYCGRAVSILKKTRQKAITAGPATESNHPIFNHFQKRIGEVKVSLATVSAEFTHRNVSEYGLWMAHKLIDSVFWDGLCKTFFKREALAMINPALPLVSQMVIENSPSMDELQEHACRVANNAVVSNQVEDLREAGCFECPPDVSKSIAASKSIALSPVQGHFRVEETTVDSNSYLFVNPTNSLAIPTLPTKSIKTAATRGFLNSFIWVR